MTVVSDSHYQTTLDAVHVHVVPWSELLIVLSNPHYPQGGGGIPAGVDTRQTLGGAGAAQAGCAHADAHAGGAACLRDVRQGVLDVRLHGSGRTLGSGGVRTCVHLHQGFGVRVQCAEFEVHGFRLRD